MVIISDNRIKQRCLGYRECRASVQKIHLDRDARDERREICNLWKNKIVEVCEERPETFGIRNKPIKMGKALGTRLLLLWVRR